jgi:hypothetical protein
MTNDEILEAEKVIANSIEGVRDYLSLIATTTEVEKLFALVLEKKHGGQLSRIWDLKEIIYPQLTIVDDYLGEIAGCLDKIYMPAVGAEAAPQRADEFKKRMMDGVKDLPRAHAALDKIAQELKQPPNPKAGG